MQRRHFIANLGALSATAATSRVFAKAKPLRVGVVGGGIVGASLALHLSEAGAKVTLFEKTGPAQGATMNSFAWVNAFVSDAHYRALRMQSVLAYRMLDQPWGLNIIWGGYLNWASTGAEAALVQANGEQMADTGYPVRLIEAGEFAALDPKLVPGLVTRAFYSSLDGHLDPVAVTKTFLARAQAQGAAVHFPCELNALHLKGARLTGVGTTCGDFPLDRLVVAAGVDSPKVLALAGHTLTLKHQPGILAHSAPTTRLSRVIHDAPGVLSFKQMADGSVVATDAPEPPDLPQHREIRAHAIDFPDEALRAYHGNRILTKVAAFWPSTKGLALERLTLGFRPMPSDEFPVMGVIAESPDIHIAVTHSGVTLAPIVGRYTAAEVLQEDRIEMFAPYRPERFARG